MIVTYTGYRKATATVNVAAGGAITQNFDLINSLHAETAPCAPVRLAEFVVSSEREGNATATLLHR